MSKTNAKRKLLDELDATCNKKSKPSETVQRIHPQDNVSAQSGKTAKTVYSKKKPDSVKVTVNSRKSGKK